MFKWFPQNQGYSILINPYNENFPTATICVLDIETDEKDHIVCIGLTENGQTAKIFFDIRPELIAYLQKVQIVAHGFKGAEAIWLEKYGIGIEQLIFDTQVGYYTFDSTKKSYALKKILKDLFQISYPTYKELIENKQVLEQSCIENDLWEFTKKDEQKLPKSLTLDKVSQDIVAAYNGSDCIFTYKLWMWLREHYTAQHWNFFNEIEFPMYKLIYQMEKKGVKIDTKEVLRIHKETSKARRKAKNKLKNFAKEIIDKQIIKEKDPTKLVELIELARRPFNPNSPQQVLPILRKAGANVDATDEDTISRFKEIPIVETLLEYRGLQKICSTYTIPLYFNAIKDPEHRIHARFGQNTITGRLSSSDPINLQNQPKEVRSCFVAKDGYNLIGADWSNIELRLPAHYSGEPNFLAELCSTTGDLHKRTAEFLFGQSFISATDDIKKEMRQKAKTCNFLLTNSGTSKRLSTELHIDQQTSDGLYKRFWEGYSTLAAWLKKEKEIARKNGGVTTMFGRWVSIPQLSLTCGRWNCAKIDKWCKQCFMREEAERQAISVLIQGSASDLMKLSAIRLKNEYGLIPILSVHDELLFEIEESKCEEVKQQIQQVMENIVTLKVPLKTKINVGKSWREAH